MESHQLDRFVRTLSRGISRRGVVAGLGGLLATGIGEATAKRQNKTRNDHNQERRKDRRKGASKNGATAPASSRVQPPSEKKVQICHYDTEANRHKLLLIAKSAWPAHQGHGDDFLYGACCSTAPDCSSGQICSHDPDDPNVKSTCVCDDEACLAADEPGCCVDNTCTPTDFANDIDNCGACGNACGTGSFCCDGDCTVGAWVHQTTFGSGPGSGASQFDYPAGVAVSADGKTAWIADSDNRRISVWTMPGGSWVHETNFGHEPGQVLVPWGVAIAADEQTVWAVDFYQDLIEVWTKSEGSWVYETTFGSGGSGPSQFLSPQDAAVAPDGQTVWVADVINRRISVWTKSGGSWVNETTFGSEGSDPSQFDYPAGVAVSADGKTAWIADRRNDRISVWTNSGGTWVNQTTFGSEGSGSSQFNGPTDVAVSPDGQTVWVVDHFNGRISLWTKSGGSWINQTTFGSEGSGPSQFHHPGSVAVSADGQTVLVSDTSNHRISVWTVGCPGT